MATQTYPSPAEALEEAARLLETHGVCRSGKYEEKTPDGTTRYCILGAIKHALGDDGLSELPRGYSTARAEVVRALHRLGHAPASITHFNDSSTSDIDVIDVVREAARGAREQERS